MDQRRALTHNTCGLYRGTWARFVRRVFEHDQLYVTVTSGTIFSGCAYCGWIRGWCRQDEDGHRALYIAVAYSSFHSGGNPSLVTALELSAWGLMSHFTECTSWHIMKQRKQKKNAIKVMNIFIHKQVASTGKSRLGNIWTLCYGRICSSWLPTCLLIG